MNGLPTGTGLVSGLGAAALLAVAVGGAAGSVLRYVIGVVLMRFSGAFPVGTLLVNVLGSLLIGVFSRPVEALDDDPLLRLALTAGFCGGFTTFSLFSAEVVTLMQQGKAARAIAYVVISVSAGVVAMMAGLARR